jgi:uncharacterized membrane protein YgaE (UPF0421/DUF939 family)
MTSTWRALSPIKIICHDLPMPRDQDSRVGEFTSQMLSRGQTTLAAGFERSLQVFQLHGVRHWFKRESDAFTQTIKTAGACAVAWLLAKHFVQHGPNVVHAVLAPVATLITMQVTIYQTFRRGLQQVAAVILGVIAALILGTYIDLTWYTLSVLVIIALMIGRTLRLGTQVNQVATTALLVYSLGKGYGFERVWDTLIGAAVGFAANALIAPPTFSRTAAKELADLADDLAKLCRDVAKGLQSTWTADEARAWLDRSRALSGASHDAEDVADQAEEAVRYHPRRSAHEADVHRVDQASVCLSHVASQLNGLLRGLFDLAAGNRGIPAGTDVPASLGILLLDAGRALNRFARLQIPDRDSRKILAELKVIITAADEHMMTAMETMLPMGDDAVERWPVHGALLDDARRMLYELDPVDGPHPDAIPELPNAVGAVAGAST